MNTAQWAGEWNKRIWPPPALTSAVISQLIPCHQNKPHIHCLVRAAARVHDETRPSCGPHREKDPAQQQTYFIWTIYQEKKGLNARIKRPIRWDSLCGFIEYKSPCTIRHFKNAPFKDCTQVVGYLVVTAAVDSAHLSMWVWCEMSDVILMEGGQSMCICSKKTWKSSASALSHFKMKFLPSLIWQTCVWYSLQRKSGKPVPPGWGNLTKALQRKKTNVVSFFSLQRLDVMLFILHVNRCKWVISGNTVHKNILKIKVRNCIFQLVEDFSTCPL